MNAAASEITAAVRAWLEGLNEAQRAGATFPFESEERFVWAYTPGPREGLALRDMEPAQREAARAIVAATMSGRGAGEVAAIIDLEPILGELERRFRERFAKAIEKFWRHCGFVLGGRLGGNASR